MNTIRTRFVRIGNSRGLRIPKVVIDQLGLGGEVALSVLNDRLVIQAASKSREGWEQAFCQMAEQGDDTLLDGGHRANAWDKGEWEW